MDIGSCESGLAGLRELALLSMPNEELADTSSAPITWSKNQTKVLLDLYQKYRVKVGTVQIKNLKKLWEILAQELNKLLKTNFAASQIENRWRVLERAYKRHVDNQNKTGQGKKYFEYMEEMDLIFKGKKNVNPVVLLSSESIEKIPDDTTEETVQSLKTPRSSPTTSDQKSEGNFKRKRTPVINRNLTLAFMRRDRREYHDARLSIEVEKLKELKRRSEAMEVRNILLKERNEILKNHKCVLCSKDCG